MSRGNYDAAAVEGRVVQIAHMQGSEATLDLRRLMVKQLTHTGSILRPRSIEEKATIAQALEKKVLPLLAQGRAKPVIDSTFPLQEVARAHFRMEAGEHIGKIVLTV